MTVRHNGGQAVRMAAALLLLASAGCDPHYGAPPVSSSLEEATVKGTVRVQGKPVTNGRILFRCANIRRPTAKARDVPIAKDGTYTVTTLVGDNIVAISCKELHTKQNRPYLENEKTVIVESGENTLDFDIPPVPQTASK